MSGTATFVRRLDGFTGDARLYRCEPPLTWTRWRDDGEATQSTEYVVVSATVVVGIARPETYMFPADASGEITNWCELPGSENHCLDHARVLRNAGYEVAPTGGAL